MIDVLAPLFRGEFEAYRDVLVLADDPRPGMPLDLLLAPAAFGDVLGGFAQRYNGDDRRALASLWAKHYIVKLLPPVMGATLLLRWRLRPSATCWAVLLSAITATTGGPWRLCGPSTTSSSCCRR